MLTKSNILARIKELQDNLAETAGITKLRILQEHQKIAFNSIASLHNTWIKRKDFESLTEDQKAIIAEIDTKVKTEWEYEFTAVKTALSPVNLIISAATSYLEASPSQTML